MRCQIVKQRVLLESTARHETVGRARIVRASLMQRWSLHQRRSNLFLSERKHPLWRGLPRQPYLTRQRGLLAPHQRCCSLNSKQRVDENGKDTNCWITSPRSLW
jgi:hypothetical protein